MKKIIVILFFILAAPAFASDNSKWTWGDTALEAAFAGITAMDWDQTRALANHYDPYVWETNPLLGHHPSVSRVNAYFPLYIVTHAAVAYVLPKPWRTIFQSIWIGYESDQVYNNRKKYSAGVCLHF